MALQTSYADSFGTTHGSAYLKVDSVTVYDDSASISFSVYKDASARSKGDASSQKRAVYSSIVNVTDSAFTTYFADGVLDDDTKSPIGQAYTYLKTLSSPIDLRSASDV
jgi:hypothetical protein